MGKIPGQCSELIERSDEKALDAKYAIDELQESLSGLYETAFENAQTYWQEQIDYNDSVKDLDKYINGGYHSWSNTDEWDQSRKNINLAIKSVKDLEMHLNNAVKANAIKVGSEAWYSMKQSINEAKLSVYEYQEALLDAIQTHRDLVDDRLESSQEYQRNRGNYKAERNYITNNELANINSRISDIRTAISENIAKNGAAFIGSDAYLEQVGYLSDALNQLSDKYKDLIKFDQEYYERLIDHNDEIADTTEAIFEGAEKFGEYEAIEKYESQLESLARNLSIARAESAKMEADLDAAIKSGAITKGSTEWLEQRIEIEKVRGQIQDYANDITEVNQKIRELEYEELFDRVIDKMDQFIDKIDTINGLIKDEMMYDYDTGKLTETGALALILNNNELDTGIKKLQKYAQERQRIMNDYANGLFGKETFNELMKDVTSNINSTLGEIDKSRDNILTIIKDQTKAELDVLDKVISKRQEALAKKKSYYDYDRQISDKNKDIQLLQQQIESLNGVSKYFALSILIAGKPLESCKLQHKHEIWLSANV